MNAYRAHCYERHNYLFLMHDLCELIELCGFQVRQAEWVDWMPRKGRLRVYDVLSRMPGMWFKNKFGRTLLVVAEKCHDRDRLSRSPSCYAPSSAWEKIV